MLRRRTSLHSAAKPEAGFSQLRIQAPQASCKPSSLNPGSALQSTGTQRLLPGAKVLALVRADVEGGTGAAEPLGARSGGGSRSGGALPQPARLPTINTTNPIHRLTMTLLLLEALGAGLIFVGIIWWTMFSGRKNGEIQDADDENNAK